MISISRILDARKRIAGRVLRTPMREADGLSRRAGAPVLIKCEHQQVTGSFKVRGATNAILSLSEEARRAGVVAASTGNHGRAIAYVSRATGVKAVVCISTLVPDNKVGAVEALGAEVRMVGSSQDDAQCEVDRLVRERGMTEISPFDDAAVIAGQGTLGLEMMEDAPDLGTVLVPLSGGGLISGVALAVKTLGPGTRVIGVTMERGAAMIASLAVGHPVEVAEEPTLADSLGGGIGLDNRHTFDMVRTLVDDCVTVSEAEIAESIRLAYEEEGEVIEGAAAVGIAALLAGKVKVGGPMAIVLSGKNIASDRHRRIICDAIPDDSLRHA
jgi:threonine dehydratase